MSEAGAATFNNNVTAFSDERLKDNIETLEDGLAKVEQLRGVTYTRNNREQYWCYSSRSRKNITRNSINC